MSVSPMTRVMQRIRQVVVDVDNPCESDADLLARFLSHSDSRAVSVLIRRHAPMVWGVCRRILFDHHDAEDAFQATFLVLLRKANTIKPRSMVGNWLHGVAFQTALKARAMTTKRSTREKPMATLPDPPARRKEGHPMLEFLDEELNRLPDKNRVVLVLCDLQGKTRAEAARELGWAEGTVASRLARGRQMLAKHLGRHGTVVSAAAISALLANNVASAAPASVVADTVQAAITIVSAKTMAAAGLSQQVMTLANGVVKTMFMSKLKAVVAVVLMLGFMASGATVLTYHAAAAKTYQPPAAEGGEKTPPKPEPEKEAFTVWGKEIGGLQAGLGFPPGEKRAYTHGETVNLVVRVRNVSKEDVKFQYLKEFFRETSLAVTDSKGKQVLLREPLDTHVLHIPVEVNLAPGKEIELYERMLVLSPAYGTGTVQIQYERVFGNSSFGRIKLDPTLSKLATGKLELEVKEKEAEKLPEKKLEKEGFTAWAKEFGGLQAGLGYRPGEHRAYHHGETVTLVVRVRNVGKEEVKFQYFKEFLTENPPSVTDRKGKPVRLVGLTRLGIHIVDVSLAPGKEIELYEWTPELRPASERDEKPNLSTLYGTGKFQIQCERVLGDPSEETIPLATDPTLSKLATGKLELDVKTAPPKPEKEQEKEGLTAWGKEVGGLQAGLGYRPGQKRAYSPGETVKVVVRVRNVGKEEVKFQYLKEFFIETPPTVTDGDGKAVPLGGRDAGGLVHVPAEVNLAPGKEIELAELKFDPRSGAQSAHPGQWNLWETGKFSVQYEQLAHPDIDKTLSNLATGKLELVIKTAEEREKPPQK